MDFDFRRAEVFPITVSATLEGLFARLYSVCGFLGIQTQNLAILSVMRLFSFD